MAEWIDDDPTEECSWRERRDRTCVCQLCLGLLEDAADAARDEDRIDDGFPIQKEEKP